MGFTSGFFGGITLTTSILYLTLSLHQRNRLSQSTYLRSSAQTLNAIVEPLPILPPPPIRIERTDMVETAKDKWNQEIEGAVKWAQGLDWRRVREGMESRVAGVWGRGAEGMREGVQKVEER
ncbi:MAG: hypothetical protein M1827_005360 [Pycnora praestabilis]|nr:MAG: hypothetical protein M1827_005360 [Pycnora praestabilis]